MNDTGTVEGTLRAKKAELESQLAAWSAKPEEQGSISFGKRVGEGTSMAVERLSQVAAYDQLQITLADVDRALAKVGDGSYGRCDVCGKPIPEGRLEALPWAVLCVEDAARR
ncbi:TraR/DksA family transcriptional regulator [Nocardioides mesophilus]|uniref:TraR/DksA C4-type zinc finger protein n=1 Tax=Nocardioides mesophilus TaxID=433659 RepID=A0A7G9RCX4_9ACTN|nr:TraR/DksA C4-type zinc finger protein [Nocardioides mesophilus]QNN53449.1 TraR/DksA C4-type zinc finger protein [Nocardioides mesophilus]